MKPQNKNSIHTYKPKELDMGKLPSRCLMEVFPGWTNTFASTNQRIPPTPALSCLSPLAWPQTVAPSHPGDTGYQYSIKIPWLLRAFCTQLDVLSSVWLWSRSSTIPLLGLRESQRLKKKKKVSQLKGRDFSLWVSINLGGGTEDLLSVYIYNGLNSLD